MPTKKVDQKQLISSLETWFQKNQRQLNFRENKNAYRVWLSEIMLQQTQVAVVEAYFDRFLKKFPTVEDLAKAKEDEVLSLWSGLGYYSRARNLHKCAKIITDRYGGNFPQEKEALLALPGIGSYTAGAILAFAFNKKAPVVDGNVSRVLSRLFADSTEISSGLGKKHFENLSESLVQISDRPGMLQEAIMELGATLCSPSSPNCTHCPANPFCSAKAQGIQGDLPVKKTKVKKTMLHMAFAIFEHQGRVYLEKDQENSLFGGLYRPPFETIEEASQAREALDRILLKFSLCDLEPVNSVTVRRTLTHRNLHLHGFVVNVPKSFLKKYECVEFSELHKFGVSTAVKKLLEAAI